MLKTARDSCNTSLSHWASPIRQLQGYQAHLSGQFSSPCCWLQPCSSAEAWALWGLSLWGLTLPLDWPGRTLARGSKAAAAGTRVAKCTRRFLRPQQILHPLSMKREADLPRARICSCQQLGVPFASPLQLSLVPLASSSANGGRTWCP